MKYYQDALFHQLIAARHKPELLLGSCDLHRLQSFIDGYLFALRNTDVPLPDHWFDAFMTYVNLNHNCHLHSYNFANIILSKGYSHQSGIQYFYELLDGFSSEYVYTDAASTLEDKLDRNVQVIRLGQSAIGELLMLTVASEKDPCSTTELYWDSDCVSATVIKYNSRAISAWDIKRLVERLKATPIPLCTHINGTYIPFQIIQV